MKVDDLELSISVKVEDRAEKQIDELIKKMSELQKVKITFWQAIKMRIAGVKKYRRLVKMQELIDSKS